MALPILEARTWESVFFCKAEGFSLNLFRIVDVTLTENALPFADKFEHLGGVYTLFNCLKL